MNQRIIAFNPFISYFFRKKNIPHISLTYPTDLKLRVVKKTIEFSKTFPQDDFFDAIRFELLGAAYELFYLEELLKQISSYDKVYFCNDHSFLSRYFSFQFTHTKASIFSYLFQTITSYSPDQSRELWSLANQFPLRNKQRVQNHTVLAGILLGSVPLRSFSCLLQQKNYLSIVHESLSPELFSGKKIRFTYLTQSKSPTIKYNHTYLYSSFLPLNIFYELYQRYYPSVLRIVKECHPKKILLLDEFTFLSRILLQVAKKKKIPVIAYPTEKEQLLASIVDRESISPIYYPDARILAYPEFTHFYDFLPKAIPTYYSGSLVKKQGNISRKEMMQRLGLPHNAKYILFAAQQYAEVYKYATILQKAAKQQGIYLVIRPHPVESGLRYRLFAPSAILYREGSFEDVLIHSEFLVTNNSFTRYQAYLLSKKVLLLDFVPLFSRHWIDEQLYLCRKPEELGESIKKVLKGDPKIPPSDPQKTSLEILN